MHSMQTEGSSCLRQASLMPDTQPMSQMQYDSRIQPGSPYLRCHLTASVKLLYRYCSAGYRASRRGLICNNGQLLVLLLKGLDPQGKTRGTSLCMSTAIEGQHSDHARVSITEGTASAARLSENCFVLWWLWLQHSPFPFEQLCALNSAVRVVKLHNIP